MKPVSNDPEDATQAFIDENGFDPWETEDPRVYDRNRYYTRSTNKHDHQAHVRVNMPRHVVAQIDALVRSQRIPQYRTREDVIRDSTYHNLQYRNETVLKNPALERTVTLEMWHCQLAQMIEEADAMGELSREFERAVKMGLRTKNYLMVETAIQVANDALDQMVGRPKANLGKLVKKYQKQLELDV